MSVHTDCFNEMCVGGEINVIGNVTLSCSAKNFDGFGSFLFF